MELIRYIVGDSFIAPSQSLSISLLLALILNWIIRQHLQRGVSIGVLCTIYIVCTFTIHARSGTKVCGLNFKFRTTNRHVHFHHVHILSSERYIPDTTTCVSR